MHRQNEDDEVVYNTPKKGKGRAQAQGQAGPPIFDVGDSDDEGYDRAGRAD